MASILIQMLAKLYTENLGKWIELMKTCKEQVGNSSLGQYVSLNCSTKENDRLQYAWQCFWINLALLTAPAQAIVSCHYDAIKKRPEIEAFFNQFSWYRKFKQIKETGKVQTSVSEDDNILIKWLKLIYNVFGYEFGLIEAVKKIVTAITLVCTTVVKPEMSLDAKKVVFETAIKQILECEDTLVALCFIDPLAWRTIKPTIDLDFYTISSMIITLEAYRTYEPEKAQEIPIKPWIKTQKYKIRVPRQFVYDGWINENGEVNIILDLLGEPNEIELDTYGLTKTLKFRYELPPFNIKVKSPDGWIDYNTPNWKKYFMDYAWTKYAIEDILPYEGSDKDHDDVILYVAEWPEYWDIRVCHGEHGYTNEVWIGDTRICFVEPSATKEEKEVGWWRYMKKTGEIIRVR